MRKWVAGSIVVLFCLVMINCGGGNDPHAVMKDVIGVFEGFVSDLEKAGSADDVAKAMNTYSDKMEALIPRMQAVKEKHPELFKQNMSGDLPEGFEKEEARLKELMPKMMGSMAKMGQYGSDPKVQEAQKRMTQVMMKVQ